MKKKIVLGVLLLIASLGNAQIIDKYGLRVGGGLSNQHLEYTNLRFSGLNGWKDNALGLSVYLNAEKKITNFLSLRPEIGYLQKGYKQTLTLSNMEGTDLQSLTLTSTTHNISSNIGFKISPINSSLKPYFVAGIRANYYFSNKIKIDDNSHNVSNNQTSLYDYNKFTLSGLIGLGFEFKDLLYLDVEYNPAITKNLNESSLSITDRYFGATLGVNIKPLLCKKQ